jgi:predicted class III extradiol MEMO1 family dioxygenase
VPIIVGEMTDAARSSYARVFASYLKGNDFAWVVSSDFCHWGGRFR